MEYNIFYENIFIIPIIAYLVSVTIKTSICYDKINKETIFDSLLGSGGMPSVHSAIVSSITAAAFFKGGFSSDFFGVTFAFALLFMYDAVNLRNQAGMHARELNRLVGTITFNESLGHTPFQVFVGAMVGISVALVLYII